MIDEPNTDAHSDFLSYRALPYQRVRFVIMSVFSYVVTFAVILALTSIATRHILGGHHISLTYWITVGVVAALLNVAKECRGNVTDLRCSTYGLIVSTMTHRGDRCIKWQEIKELKRKSSRLSKSTRLNMNDGSSLNLALIPVLIQDNLALIMSEATNARVIGFDHND